MRASVMVAIVVTAALAVAAPAYATGYVAEKFEKAVPPAKWTVKTKGSAGWTQRTGGPWGNYARGAAASSNNNESWAKMDTYSFNVAANTTLEYRFDYKYGHGGFAAPSYAKFYLFYVGPPEEEITSAGMALTSKWVVFTGKPVAKRSGAVKARFEVWVKNPDTRHTAVYAWDVDNVVIAKAANHAVSPTSLGRVKALFK
jgi:hypothetical protein